MLDCLICAKRENCEFLREKTNLFLGLSPEHRRSLMVLEIINIAENEDKLTELIDLTIALLKPKEINPFPMFVDLPVKFINV